MSALPPKADTPERHPRLKFSRGFPQPEFCAPLLSCVQWRSRYTGATATAALCIVINGPFMRADGFARTT